MTNLERIDNAMSRIQAAMNAASRMRRAISQVEDIGIFELTDKRSKQYYRLMQFYGDLLHDLSKVQDAILLALPAESDAGCRPWDDPAATATA